MPQGLDPSGGVGGERDSGWGLAAAGRFLRVAGGAVDYVYGVAQERGWERTDVVDVRCVDRVGRLVDGKFDGGGFRDPARIADGDGSRRLVTAKCGGRVAGRAVEHGHEVWAAAGDRGDVDRVGARVDRDVARIAARHVQRRDRAAAGLVGRVAGAVVEYADRPAGAGDTGVGDVIPEILRGGRLP